MRSERKPASCLVTPSPDRPSVLHCSSGLLEVRFAAVAGQRDSTFWPYRSRRSGHPGTGKLRVPIVVLPVVVLRGIDTRTATQYHDRDRKVSKIGISENCA